MKIISKSFLLSSAFSLVLPQTAFASLSSAYASLVDTSQNQTFESRPQAAASSKRPVSSPVKFAAVHFITNDGGLNFGGSNPGNQEFLPSDLCKNNGYLYEGCPAGYVPGEACPEDNSFVKECIDPETWCKDNGYNTTSCTLPKYLSDKCSYSDVLYKSCEEDNARACKEAGYSAECETGKIKDKACPYDSSYGTCVCNPCTGFAYTAAEASAQGYIPGEVCNSCGTMKYKRSEAPCDGFKTCDCGGATNAKTCWSGTTKMFDTCKECCDSKFQYDSSNCSGDYQLVGNSCGGKYESCIKPCSWANMYAQSDSYLAWGNECELKRTRAWEFDIDKTFFFTSECLHSCQSIPINFSYNGQAIRTTIKYFTPSEEQKNSPETVVTTCQAYKDALDNPDIFNIRISGHIICDKMTIRNTADKHIYGLDKSKDILETTRTSNSYLITANHAILSNLTINVETDRNSPFSTIVDKEPVWPVAENVDLYVNGEFDESIFFTKGDNHIYITDKTANTPSTSGGTLIVGSDASLTLDSPRRRELYYRNVILLGKFQSNDSWGLRWEQLLMQGSPKTLRYKTLNKGTYYGLFYDSYRNGVGHMGYVLDVVGDDSSVSFASGSISDDFAIGNNATATIESLSNGLRFCAGTGAIVNSNRVSSAYAGKNMTFPNEPYSNLFK